jgi:hypothetical protein
METPYLAPLTPEQLAAVAAGRGFARCEDPNTHVVYELIQQPTSPAIDERYIRQKIEEAYADIAQNGYQPLDMAAIKQEFERRLAAQHNATR